MEKIGSVLVVGGGIAGIQASMDLADSGYKVYLVESTMSIGGVMSQLIKLFLRMIVLYASLLLNWLLQDVMKISHF